MANQNDQNQANKDPAQRGGAGSDTVKKTGQQPGQHQAESSRTGQQGGHNPGRNDDDRMSNTGKDKGSQTDKGSHQK